MRRWERATRLAGQQCSSRPVQSALGYSRHFHASALLQADNGSSNNNGNSGSAAPPRTNKARVEEAYRQISRLREARSKADASKAASEKSAATTQPPVNKRVLIRRVDATQAASRPSRSKGDSNAGVQGGRGKRGRKGNAPESRGDSSGRQTTTGKRRTALDRDAGQKLVVDEYDEFDGDEDEDEEDDEDGQWMQGHPEDIIEESRDEFNSDAEADAYAHILHKMRDLEKNLAVAEEMRTSAEEGNDRALQSEAQEMEDLIDQSIEEIMDDLSHAHKAGAPPTPVKPFDVSEFYRKRGGIPTASGGMGNIIEESLHYLGDREDGEWRSPMKLGQRLIDGQFNRYNTLVEKNEAHIRAGHLRPQEEEKERKEHNLANKIDHAALIKLFVKRRAKHRVLRNVQHALDEADDEMPQHAFDRYHKARDEAEKSIADLTAQITAARGRKSPHTGSGLSMEQRRTLVKRLVQGRYQDPVDQRLRHPALQNVARILGTNSSYRPEAMAKVLDTLRSMIPTERQNMGREQRRS